MSAISASLNCTSVCMWGFVGVSVCPRCTHNTAAASACVRVVFLVRNVPQLLWPRLLQFLSPTPLPISRIDKGRKSTLAEDIFCGRKTYYSSIVRVKQSPRGLKDLNSSMDAIVLWPIREAIQIPIRIPIRVSPKSKTRQAGPFAAQLLEGLDGTRHGWVQHM